MPSPTKAQPERPRFDAVAWMIHRRIFTRAQFIAAHPNGKKAPSTAETIIRYHLAQGRIRVLRRGLYCVEDADPFMVASQLAPDAVLAYDGAAAFWELLYRPPLQAVTYLSKERVPEITLDGVLLRRVKATSPRREAQVEAHQDRDWTIFVTDVTRTLVDLLDRLDLGPGPEVVWECFLRGRARIDLAGVLQRARLVKNATTCARLGVFLEHLLPSEHPTLAALQKLRPAAPVYFDQATRGGLSNVFFKRWNLVVSGPLRRALSQPPIIVGALTPNEFTDPALMPEDSDSGETVIPELGERSVRYRKRRPSRRRAQSSRS